MAYPSDRLQLSYKDAGGFLLRTPLLPIEYRDWLPTPISGEAVRVESHDNTKGIESIVLEALLVSSPSLHTSLSRIADGEILSHKRRTRAEDSVRRYISRMTARPTPFGLFAGVSTGTFAEHCEIVLRPPWLNRKRARPSTSWLTSQLQAVELRGEVLPNLCLTSNPLLVTIADRIYLPFSDAHCGPNALTPSSVRNSALLSTILKLSRDGVSYSDLLTAIQCDWPKVAEVQFRTVLSELLQRAVLVSNLHPNPAGSDPFTAVVQHLALPYIDQEWELQVSAIITDLLNYNTSALGAGEITYRSLLASLSKGSFAKPLEGKSATLQIDMATAPLSATLPGSVVDDASRAAELLLRLNPRNKSFVHLDAYRKAFLDKYGQMREIPLVELLDSRLGLGAPATYVHPNPVRHWTVNPRRHEKRDSILLDLATKSIRDRTLEVVLHEEHLAGLETDPQWRDILPRSLDLFFSLAAGSAASVDQGDYRLVIGAATGNVGGGASLGRFYDLCEPHITEIMGFAALQDQLADPDFCHVDLIPMPQTGVQGDLSTRPSLRRHELALCVAPNTNGQHRIDVRDLVVSVFDGRFMVRSQKSGEYFRFFSGTRFNTMHAANIGRFLLEVSLEGTAQLFPFDWGAAQNLPFLPRLSVANIVLSPARWQITMDSIQQNSKDARLVDRVRDWWREWEVPQSVLITEGDNRLPIDLSHAGDMNYLAKCLKSAEIVRLEESIPEAHQYWVLDDEKQHYASEFVVPLVLREPPTEHLLSPHLPYRNLNLADESSSFLKRDRALVPGSECLFLKLYCCEELQNEILIDHIYSMIRQCVEDDTVTKWFFIRFTDPEPHIRLRFFGDPRRLNETVLPHISAWGKFLIDARMVSRIMFDTYDREIERYGGYTSIETMEDLFCTDSRVTLDILTIGLPQDSEIRSLFAITSAHLLVDAWSTSVKIPRDKLLPMLRASGKALGEQTRRDLNAKFRAIRGRVVTMIRDGLFDDLSLNKDLVEALLSRSALMQPHLERVARQAAQDEFSCPVEDIVMSILHMHSNRVFGIDREFEQQTLYLLGRSYDTVALLERQKIDYHF